MGQRKKSTNRKAEIVSAALKLAGEIGPERVSTNNLAKEVGISQPAIFKHFSNTEEIWTAAVHWMTNEAALNWRQAQRKDGSALKQIRAVIVAHLAFVQKNPAVSSLIFSRELQSRFGELRQAIQKMIGDFSDLLEKLVRKAQEDGLLNPQLPPPGLVQLILNVVPGLVTRWILSGRSFDLAAVGDSSILLLLDLMAKHEGDFSDMAAA